MPISFEQNRTFDSLSLSCFFLFLFSFRFGSLFYLKQEEKTPYFSTLIILRTCFKMTSSLFMHIFAVAFIIHLSNHIAFGDQITTTEHTSSPAPPSSPPLKRLSNRYLTHLFRKYGSHGKISFEVSALLLFFPLNQKHFNGNDGIILSQKLKLVLSHFQISNTQNDAFFNVKFRVSNI